MIGLQNSVVTSFCVLIFLLLNGCGLEGSNSWTNERSSQEIATHYNSFSVSQLCTKWDNGFLYGSPFPSRLRSQISAALVRKGMPSDHCYDREWDRFKAIEWQAELNKPREKTVNCTTTPNGFGGFRTRCK